MASSRTLTVVIAGDASGARGAFGAAEAGADSFQQKLTALGAKMKSVGRTMTFGVTLPIVGAFALATKAAMDEQQEIAKLNAVLKNSTVLTDANRKAVEKQITAWQNSTGIADGKLRPALSNLIVAGMDWTQSQKTMAIAMDVATAKGIPLETVTKAMSRAYLGSTTSLSRLGIATTDAAGNTLTFDQIMQNAAQKMGGSAAKAANTAAGRMAILKARFADAVEELGTNLLPILERLIGIVTSVIGKFNGLSEGQQKLILIVGGVVAAIGPLLWLFGSLVTVITAVSLPVLVIGGAIAALAAAAVLLYVKWDEVWSWMKDHPAIAALIVLMTGPITIPIIAFVGLLRLMQGHWDEVWSVMQAVAQAVWPVIEGIFAALDAVIRTVVDAAIWLGGVAADAFSQFASDVQTMWGIVDGPLGWLYNRLQDIIDAARTVKNAISGVLGQFVPDGQGVSGSSVEDIVVNGRRAAGGPVSPGTWLVGERGPELLSIGASGYVTPNRMLGGGPSIVVNVGGSVITDRQLDEVVATSLARWQRHNGRN